MIKNNNNIKISTAFAATSPFTVDVDDIEYYISLIEQGEEAKAIDLFIQKYLVEPSEAYNMLMEYYMEEEYQGEITAAKQSKIEKSIALLTYGFSTLLAANFAVLTKKLFSPVIFNERSIRNAKVKATILKATLGQFESLTSKSLSGTQVDILKNIRTMQQEMIIFNQGKGSYLKGKKLDTEIMLFKERLLKKYPDYFKMKDGNIVATKAYGVNNTVRYYKLKDYIEMSARTTLLNIDRISSQIAIENKETLREQNGRTPVRVAQYYLRDNRPLKTGIEREICQDILADKRYGVPLLALDQVTADLLGIMTVDEAMNSKDGAMGPYCRHSVKPVTVYTRKKLERILRKKLKETNNVK